VFFREDIKGDTALYMWDMKCYAISRYRIKEYNIKLLIPSYYENYNVLVIQYAHFDYSFKQDKRNKYTYKYVETENLLYNVKYYRYSRRKWKHAQSVDNIDIRIKQ
jgi:hypothetical protein